MDEREEIARIIDPDAFDETKWTRPFSRENWMRFALAKADAILARRTPIGWRTIESAPRDRTVVDLWGDGCRSPNMYWHERHGAWAYTQWRRGRAGPYQATMVRDGFEPTHWQPLPDPPASPLPEPDAT